MSNKRAGVRSSFLPVRQYRSLMRGVLFLSSFVLFLFVLAAGIALGTFFFHFISKGVLAHMERTVNLTADTCAMANSPAGVLDVTATAYSSTPGQTDSTPCITATGYDVCENYALYGSANTIASNFLPLHSIVKIPELFGDQLFVVRDKMNSRFGGNNIDIWMPTYAEARSFGTRQIVIEVY